MADAPDYSELSIEQLTEIIDRNPNDLEAHQSRALLYLKADDIGRAKEDFLHMYDSGEKSIFVHVMLLFCATKKKDLASVSKFSGELENLTPIDVDDYYFLSVLYYNIDQTKKCWAILSKGLRKFPNKAGLWHLRGQLKSGSGQVRQAESDLLKAVGLEKGDDTYFYDLAGVQKSLEKGQEAIDSLTEAIRLNGEKADYYFERAELYVKRKSYEPAREDITAALAIDPFNEKYASTLAEITGELGLEKETIDAYKLLFQIAPASIIEFLIRANTKMNLDLTDLAIEYLEKSIQEKAANSDYYHELAVLHAYKGNLDKSLPLIKHAVKLAPANANYLTDFALFWLMLGKPNRCFNILKTIDKVNQDNSSTSVDSTFKYLWSNFAHESLDERIPKLDTKSARLYFQQAVCLYYYGLDAPATEYLKRAAAIKPADSAISTALAFLLIQHDEYQDASSLLGALLELNPAVPFAHILLAECHLFFRDLQFARDCLIKALKYQDHDRSIEYGLIRSRIRELRKLQQSTFSRSQPTLVRDIFKTEELCDEFARMSIQGIKKKIEKLYNRKILDAAGYHALARLHLLLMNLSESKCAIEKAIENDPNRADLYYNKAIIEFLSIHSHRYILKDSYQKYESFPEDENGDWSHILPYILGIKNRNALFVSVSNRYLNFADVKSALKKAIDRDEANLQYHRALGLLFFQGNDKKQAAKELSRVLKTDQADPVSLVAFAEIQFEQQKYVAAAAPLKRTLQHYPSTRIHYYLGRCCYGANQFADACTCFEEALKIAPSDPNILLWKGKTLYFLSQYEQAAEALSEAAEKSNTTIEALLYLASCQIRSGRYQEMLPLTEKALVLEPENPFAYLYKSMAHFSVNNYEESIADLKNFSEKKGYDYLSKSYQPLWTVDPEDPGTPFSKIKYSFSKYRHDETAIKLFTNFIEDFGSISIKSVNLWFIKYITYILNPRNNPATQSMDALEELANTADTLNNLSSDTARKELTSRLAAINNDLIKRYPLFNSDLIENRELQNIIIKNTLIQELGNSYSLENMRKFSADELKGWSYVSSNDYSRLLKKKNTQLVNLSLLQFVSIKLNTALQSKFYELVHQFEREKWEARIDERNRLLANLSHSIKNNLSNVIDPLRLAEADSSHSNPQIQHALISAYRISDIVNAINYSVKGSVDDFIFDIQNIKEAKSLDELILDACITATNNMFDGRNFAPFTQLYFPSKTEYMRSKEDWQEISEAPGWSRYLLFMKEHMITFEAHIDKKMRDLRIGDSKKSFTKLLLLFQEIILNAIKYSAPVDKESRFITITLAAKDKLIVFDIKNRFRTDFPIKSSGLGRSVIENLADLLKTVPAVKIDGDTYSLVMEFDNFWLEAEK